MCCFPKASLSLLTSYLVPFETGTFVYFVTTLSSYSDGTVTEVTRHLSVAQHESIERERADTSRPKVVQRRVSFLWERQAFELHIDTEPAYGVNVLHRRSEVSISRPPSVKIVDQCWKREFVVFLLATQRGVGASTSERGLRVVATICWDVKFDSPWDMLD